MAPLLACVSAISSLPSVLFLFPCLWQVAAAGNQGPEQPPGNLSLSQSNAKGQRATRLGKMIMPPQMNIACWSLITQPENSPDCMEKESDSRGDWARRGSSMMWGKRLHDLPHRDIISYHRCIVYVSLRLKHYTANRRLEMQCLRRVHYHIALFHRDTDIVAVA